MENVTNWQETFEKFPVWLKTLLNLISQIIKAPNFIWNLPGLKKLKGIRLLVISALGFLYTFLQSMDIDLLSQAICGAAQMMKVVCEPGMIVGTLKAIMAWLALGLAIEDKTK